MSANYPKDLDRIEFMNFINTGDFHIADTFEINHNSPNLIHLVPKATGVFKLLAQKIASDMTDGSNELEIMMYDPREKKMLSKTSNNHLNIINPNLQSELDYSILRIEIDQKMIGKPLYIVFHAFNESHDEDCMKVYLEIEFASTA
jgi:hypothetical protein